MKANKIVINIKWGEILQETNWSLWKKSLLVDLDTSLALFDKSGNELETISFQNPLSSNKSIAIEESSQQNQQDTVSIALSRVPENAAFISLFVNNYDNSDLSKLSTLETQIFNGQGWTSFAATSLKRCKDNFSILIGNWKRQAKNSWSFSALYEPLKASNIQQSINNIQNKLDLSPTNNILRPL